MQQKTKPDTDYVSVSIKLTGDEAKKFLRLKELRFIKNNSELARTLLMPTLESELKKFKSMKSPIAA